MLIKSLPQNLSELRNDIILKSDRPQTCIYKLCFLSVPLRKPLSTLSIMCFEQLWCRVVTRGQCLSAMHRERVNRRG